MKLKLIFCLALVLIGVLCGCSTANRPACTTAANDAAVPNPGMPSVPPVVQAVTNAINREDWKFLRKLTGEGMTAKAWIDNWERNPLRVGKLVETKNFDFHGQSCTLYSFNLNTRDGKFYPHWLQVIIREAGGQPAIQDFWEFGW